MTSFRIARLTTSLIPIPPRTSSVQPPQAIPSTPTPYEPAAVPTVPATTQAPPPTKAPAPTKPPGFAPPGKGTPDPRKQWTDGSGDISIYTDEDGKRWSFPNSNGTYKLDRTSIQMTASAEYKDPKNRVPPLRLNGRRVMP